MLRHVTILVVLDAVRAGHTPSSLWCTGDEDAPLCDNGPSDRCESHHGPLDVGSTDVYNFSCPANTPMYCKFVQFKVNAGTMSVTVPNAYGLNENLWPTVGKSAESSRSSCYEFPQIDHPPVRMGYYFDAHTSPVVISNVEFHLTCDMGQAESAVEVSANPMPPPAGCSYQANVQCSCGEPPFTTQTAATSTVSMTGSTTSPTVTPVKRPPTTSKSWAGVSVHEAHVITAAMVAFIFVLICVFSLWLRRMVVRQKQEDRLAITGAGKGQPNPLFKAGNSDDVALLAIELEEDFSFIGTEDTAVWRVDPVSGRPMATPPTSTRNSPFSSPSHSPPGSPPSERADWDLVAPGRFFNPGRFDTDTGIRVDLATA